MTTGSIHGSTTPFAAAGRGRLADAPRAGRGAARWRRGWRAAALALLAVLGAPAVRAGEVEVLHFWTSPGEAKSIDELKALIGERGHTWKDFAVVGGGGGNAMQALRARVQAGIPPAAASMKGPAIQEWASQNVLTSLDAMAVFDHWDESLPEVVKEMVKYKGHYVAVPVNIHRANWLWGNRAVLAKAGVATMPATLDDFFRAADKIRDAGFVPLAMGGEPWQEFVLFDSIVLGVGGADLYRRAMISLDPAAIAGPEMRRSLELLRRMKRYTDARSPGRSWNATTRMVIDGTAGFQFMGDWAKGEFLEAGKQPGRDYLCAAAPGSGGAFSYVVDTFAMFQLKNWENQRAQGYLAFVLLGDRFQRSFNMRKGSIPVRRNVSLAGFDSCATASSADFDRSLANGGLVPSVAVDMALPSAVHAAFQDAISEFWSDDSRSVSDTVDRLLAAAQPKGRHR